MTSVLGRLRGWFGGAPAAGEEGQADGQGFVERTRPHHARLFQLALALSEDPDEAADLTQEALLRAFHARDRLRDDASIYPWLARILRNIHTDQRRSARARRERPQPLDERVADPRATPFEQTATAERRALLRRALAMLEPHHAQIVVLIDVQGLSYAEAAEALEMPIGTVRSRTSRARRALLDHIRHDDS